MGQPPGLNPAAALSFQGCRSCFYPAGRTFPLPFSGFCVKLIRISVCTEVGSRFGQHHSHRHARLGQEHCGRSSGQSLGLRLSGHRPGDPAAGGPAAPGHPGPVRGEALPPGGGGGHPHRGLPLHRHRPRGQRRLPGGDHGPPEGAGPRGLSPGPYGGADQPHPEPGYQGIAMEPGQTLADVLAQRAPSTSAMPI